VADVRSIVAPFVALGPSGVAVRGRLKGLTGLDVEVLRQVGDELGSLAGRDLAARCRAGSGHDNAAWAARKRELTAVSSSRWAGSITKATHDQWALARRAQAAHLASLDAAIATITCRLALPLGSKGSKDAAGGYRSRQEWHAKRRRLEVLATRAAAVRADREAGRVRVVRGGKRLARNRHNPDAAKLTEQRWRDAWRAERRFLAADGESGKRFGNETIRITPDGVVSIRLPAVLAPLANAPHGRYVLTGRIAFPHRGQEWADRVAGGRAVAYRIHEDTTGGRWYVTAAWQVAPVRTLPLTAALARGVVGFDMNDDHLAAWLLDRHGNPVGRPRRFFYDLSGSAQHRDAQIRHTLTRMLHWAKTCGVAGIAMEDLDFEAEKTREKHGRRKHFRRLISRFPTARLRARLLSMAAVHGLAIVAVDAAYTSRWGAQHWRKPLTTAKRKISRHDSAAVAIGRRAQGHPIRRRTAPPPHDRSDRVGHRTVQAAPDTPRREGPRRARTGTRTRSAPPTRP
jgi:hypothetical protein